MAQRVEFAVLPGVASVALPGVLRDLFGFVRDGAATVRTVRDRLKAEGRYEKDVFPVLLDFLGLAAGDGIAVGSLGRAMLAAGDEADLRAAMRGWLVDANPLLAKYCLEALDVDRGGRLHSTNELYRMITSYVYPGARPTLGAFKAWIDWAAAAGLIRVVGIRWALGPGGEAALPALRTIDPEEFLDDERQAAAREAAPDAATPAPEPGVAPAPDAAVVPVPAPAVATSVSAPRSASVAKAPPEGAEPVAPVAPEATAPAAAVTAVPAPQPAPQPASQQTDLAFAVRARHLASGAGDPYAPAALGVEAGADDARGRVESAFGALLLGRGLAPATAARAMAALRASGAFDTAVRGRIPADALGGVLADDPAPGVLAACEMLVHLPRLAAGLKEGAWPAAPRALLDAAWQRLYAPYAPLAPFVFARFLWAAGRLDARAAVAAFVPVFTAREAAFRVGLADRLHAGSFAALADLSLAIAPSFGPPAFEAPLAGMAAAWGCAFGCPRAGTCPLPCREKGEVAPPAPGSPS
jgi:hypothetical protein